MEVLRIVVVAFLVFAVIAIVVRMVAPFVVMGVTALWVILKLLWPSLLGIPLALAIWQGSKAAGNILMAAVLVFQVIWFKKVLARM